MTLQLRRDYKSVFIYILLALLNILVLSNTHASPSRKRVCDSALSGYQQKLDFLIQEATPRVFHLAFDDHNRMAATMLRFQEHYESPQFRGLVFSRGCFKRWYRGLNNGRFTYFSDWAGFNIPSSVLTPFYTGQFPFLTPDEKRLLRQFRNLWRSGARFYIIATHIDNASALDHEIAHGLYYTNRDYRSAVDSLLAKIPHQFREQLYNWLNSTNGYHPSVWDDELHAYLTTSNPIEIQNDFARLHVELNDVIQALRSIFLEFNRRPK